MGWPLGVSLDSSGRATFAAVFAVVASLLTSLSNVLEQHEAEQVPERYALKLSLLGQLARRRRWLVGITADVLAYPFAALALGLGAVAFVAPLTQGGGLIWTLLLGWLLHRRHIPRRGWVAAFVLVAGVTLFLREVSPTGGDQTAALRAWVPALLVAAGVVAGALALTRRARPTWQAALLGVAAGTAFAVGETLTKGFVHYLGQGPLAWIPHWEPYLLPVAMIGGLLLGQSAFQTGSLAAATGATAIMGQVVGVALGITVLNEHVTAGAPPERALLVVAFLAMLFGIVTLARVEYPALRASKSDNPRSERSGNDSAL
jgi:drug/metabolite transporter (DMT)-like permease